MPTPEAVDDEEVEVSLDSTSGRGSQSWGTDTIIGVKAFTEVLRETPFQELFVFRKQHPLTRRRRLSQKLAESHPDRVPVVVHAQDPLQLDKTQFLCPNEMAVGAFMVELRNRLAVKPRSKDALFLLTDTGHTLPSAAQVSLVARAHADSSDGFLYLVLSREAAFGFALARSHNTKT